MEGYWDCSLCRIEDKGNARRCRRCSGKLRGRERLLREVAQARRIRPRAFAASFLAAGLGQIYEGRRGTGLAFAILIPGAVGLALWASQGFGYGHIFLAGALLFVMAVSAVDARLGPSAKRAPCQQACPAGVAIPDYLQLLIDRDYEQGYWFARTRIPLVGVIGRICPHPCERRCARGIDGEPISINGCKRFLADRHREAKGKDSDKPLGAGERGSALSVGVVGSGPAGLACAYYLGVLGAAVTVYEADSVAGGRLATTIPDHRLPPHILREELEDLGRGGIAIALNTAVGPGGLPLEELLRRHSAVFLGVGARRSVALRIPGAEVFLDFHEVLRGAKLGESPTFGDRVAVIGGGNAAVDVCRTLVRLGLEEVHLCYRRTRDEMPARDDEVEEAVKEGVHLHFLSDPVLATLDDGGRVRGLVLRRTHLGSADASGRPTPQPVPDSEWTLPVDSVVCALGQTVGGGVFEDALLAGLRREVDGRVWCDPVTQRTSLERLYAGGDAVSGPSMSIEAMAQGRRAALGIWGDLAPGFAGREARLADRRIRKPFAGHRETPAEKVREEMPKLALPLRSRGFDEVELGFPEPAAMREARRCLQCHREL